MKVTVNHDEGILNINGHLFYAEDVEYNVDAQFADRLPLSIIPQECSIILTERIRGSSKDYYEISPQATYTNSVENGLIASLAIIIMDEDVSVEHFGDFARHSMQQGKKRLTSLYDSGIIINDEFDVYEELAYFTLTVKMPSISFREARNFLMDIERKFETDWEQNKYLFLSHASQDKATAEAIFFALKERGIPIWFDKYEIVVGDSLIEKVSRALELTSHLIVLLSKCSVQRPWVKKELHTVMMNGLNGKDIKILPVKLDDCEIPSFLKEIKYVTYNENSDECIQQLVQAIRS